MTEVRADVAADMSARTPLERCDLQDHDGGSLWRPYVDLPLLTPAMTLGLDHADLVDQQRLLTYLSALVVRRRTPIHVNVAFNAVYYGFDLSTMSYVGGPVDPFEFPMVPMADTIDALPVGAMVRVDVGSDPLFAEIVYKEGAHPEVGDDGAVPEWLSGAPAGAMGPGRAEEVAEPFLHERAVADFDALGAGFSPREAQLDRILRRGRGLDRNGHLVRRARYRSRVEADLDEVSFYVRHLLTVGRAQLLDATAPMPLSAALTTGAGEAELASALHGLMNTVRTALARLENVRTWRGYTFTRASLAERLVDRGPLGGDDLTALASQLAGSAIPSGQRRWAESRKVTYTAVGPLLRGIRDETARLVGVDYALAVCHTNAVLCDYTHREVDPETGLLLGKVHLRLDDQWQGGGVWRAEQPGSEYLRVDVAEPLGLGWLSTVPTSVPELAPPAEDEPQPQVSVDDSQISWTVPLRLSYVLNGRLPLPQDVVTAMIASQLGGVGLRLQLTHDGYRLSRNEASQQIKADLFGSKPGLHGVDWPLDFFVGIVLTCTWPKNGGVVRMRSTLLDSPVLVDGDLLEHRYDLGVLTRDTAPGEPQTGRRGSKPAGALSLSQRVLRAVRRLGLLDPSGRAVLARAHVNRAVYGANCAAEVVLDDVIDELVAAGDLRETTAGVAGDRLIFPADEGQPTVPALMYEPAIVQRSDLPSRRPGEHLLDPRFVRQHDVAGHVRRIGHLGQAPSEKAKAAFRADREKFGLAGPAELPDGFTYVPAFQRGHS